MRNHLRACVNQRMIENEGFEECVCGGKSTNIRLLIVKLHKSDLVAIFSDTLCVNHEMIGEQRALSLHDTIIKLRKSNKMKCVSETIKK